ncbi:hypothetical protein GYMLUDRAFT_242242 [Collybiopsis luxurians FD-317 M1]|uniref:NmrA-like domain-containing protein n=1 Tax=Collybiopsis luxurians FD-317 M1 TaxID=944289 RepID=A0A0D0C4X2_9AGAR|nr:hypothetical protein GYMLUDRAFT_242242 [Collybiopsis luxurians FD-317 M1]
MKSQRIAVAGGTGKLGRHIVEGLLEIKQQHGLTVIVLSRSPGPDISFAGCNAPVIAVNYENVDSIRNVLNDYQIDTIISTLVSLTPETFITSQENLLQAGLALPSFHRFAPSEFAVDSEQVSARVNLYRMKIPILRTLERVKRERPDSFEYTRFNCGIFANYLAFGNTKPEGHKAHGHLARFPFVFDLSKRTAEIPGDGEKQTVYTRVEDVGKFVAAATQLETWEEYNEMAGDVLTMNEVIRISEDVCGAKFNVKYYSREDILAKMSQLSENVMEHFYWEFYLAYVNGDCDIKRPINLNKMVDIKPVGVRQFIEQWWG